MSNPVLTGTETLQVLAIAQNGLPAATTQTTTTGAIAALAATEGLNLVNTAITTAGNGTLTAAGLVGGQISRSGPSGAFSDATDSAAAIIALLPGGSGSQFQVLIKNSTAYVQTITAGSGVTLPTTVIVPPYSASLYFVTATSGSAVTFTHRDISPINLLNVAYLGSSSGATVVVAPATASGVNTLQAATDTFVYRATTDTLTNKTLTDVINTDTVINSTATAFAANTTLQTVTGLSVALTAAGKYAIIGQVPVTANNAAGPNLQFVGTNSLTLTSASIVGTNYNGGTVNAQTIVTALGSDFSNFANTCTLVQFRGTLTVNVAGTLNLQACQNTSSAATTTIGAGGFISLTRAS